ncbi:MAG: lipase family protein [Myxococcota bacterium]
MRMWMRVAIAGAILEMSVAVVGCRDEPGGVTQPGTTDTGVVDTGTTTTGTTTTGADESSGDPVDAIVERLARDCEDPSEQIYTTAPPEAWSPDMRGAIAGCAYDRRILVEEMTAHYAEYEEFPDPGLSTSVHAITLSYWTERQPDEPVLTSATVYVPDELRADPAPLLVLGHGSVGIADSCAPSRDDDNGFDKDWKALVYQFAGDGWIVIMPDFPGLGTEGPGTWMLSTDEGHAILDATRAARRLFEDGTLNDLNALIGQSNGGHATLSAQAMLDDYGAEGQVVANVLYSPYWLSNAAWGALVSPVGDALLNSVFMSMTLQYFYGHAYAYEGSQAALDLMLPDKAQDVAELLESECWGDVTGEELGPPSLGIMLGEDVFTEEVVDEVGTCAVLEQCESALAQAWRERWVADRPTPSPDVPIVYWLGGVDDFLPPGFQQCGIERLVANDADLTLCVDAEGGHAEVAPRTAAWVRQYLESVLLGGAAPEPCPGVDTLGMELSCTLPIVNSTDPADP